MTQLSGKTVLITGAAKGLGWRLAVRCAKEGARIVLTDVDEPNLKKAESLLASKGIEVLSWVHDVTDREACVGLAESVGQRFGAPQVLINNAGIVRAGNFLEGDAQHWKSTIDVNLCGVMWMMKAFMPTMIEANEGHVVNVASILGSVAVGGAAVYCASKHAVMGLNEAVRFECEAQGADGVRFTLVCPGFLDTGMFEGTAAPPMFRAASPEKMADRAVRGVLANKNLVRYPSRFRYLPQMNALTPTPVSEFLMRQAGAHQAMDTHSGQPRPPAEADLALL